MFRIVETDNHGSDYPDEKFVNIPPCYYRGKVENICDAINAAHCNSNSATRFWKVVPEDYVLQPGFEP